MARITGEQQSDTFALPVDAIVLAGGRGARMGGVVKAEIRVGTDRLIDLVLDGAHAAGAHRVIVVGDPQIVDASAVHEHESDREHAPRVLIAREDPPFGGPVAALAAGLPLVTTEWVLLLAVDLPRVAEICSLLARAAAMGMSGPAGQPDPDAYIVRDLFGRMQWLAGLYRADILATALNDSITDAGGNASGLPLRSVVSRIEASEVIDVIGASADIDTEEDLANARAWSQAALRSAPQTSVSLSSATHDWEKR